MKAIDSRLRAIVDCGNFRVENQAPRLEPPASCSRTSASSLRKSTASTQIVRGVNVAREIISANLTK
jgi:hypothetical protein